MKLHSIILSALLSTTVFAQGELAMLDKVYTLEELMDMTIISSTGTEQKISDAPSIATVITAEQIERSSARTLWEVLQMVPGLNVYLSSVDIQKKSYDIRGIRTNFNSQILTLINGVNLNRIHTSSSHQQFNFPASAIKRVEIIRGPGSAIYGADAFSGVINIITKDAEYLKNNSHVGIRYGSFNQTEIYGNYGEVYESGLKMGLNLSYMTSDGDRGRTITSDTQTIFDAAFGTSASLAPGSYDDRYNIYNINLNMKYKKFSMNLWTYIAKDIGLGAGVANTLDPTGALNQTEVILDLNYDTKPMRDVKWNNKLVLTYIESLSQFTIFPAGSTIPIGSDGNAFSSGGGLVTFTDGYIGNPDTHEKKIAYESTLNISKFKNQDIRISIGFTYLTQTASETKNFGPGVIDGTVSPINGTLTDVTGISSSIFIPDEDRSIFYLSAQDEYKFSENWHLTAGLRYDQYSDVGDTINPRLGLVWKTSDIFTTKLLYGRAFRAPSFAELYLKNNPASLGNKDLKPETIDMLELGTSYQLNSTLTSSLNIYAYKINNLIEGVSSSVGVESQNIGKQDGAGFEFEISYQATDQLFLKTDYSYRWTENKTTNKAVANVPIHLAHAMFDYSINKSWFLNSEIFYTADTPREVGDTRAKIDDYAIVNLSTGYKITKGLEAIVAVRNLFDEKYVSPSNTNPVNDYPMEGLNIFAELKYRF